MFFIPIPGKAISKLPRGVPVRINFVERLLRLDPDGRMEWTDESGPQSRRILKRQNIVDGAGVDCVLFTCE